MTDVNYHKNNNKKELLSHTVEINDDEDSVFSVWDDLVSLFSTCYEFTCDKQVQRWTLRLVVYPGLITGAIIFVINIRNLPRIYQRFGDWKLNITQLVDCDKCTHWTAAHASALASPQLKYFYLMAAPWGLLYNTAKGILLWPWLWYRGVQGCQAPFESILNTMKIEGPRYTNKFVNWRW